MDADTTGARAKIDELSRSQTATINVNVDDAVASARLDELARDRTADLTVREHHVSDGGGLSGVSPLLAAGVIGAPLAVPLGAAALGGVAGIATAATAGAAGLGVLALGLSGIKTAVDAVGKAHAGAGAAAIASGIAQANAAAAVKSAQAGLGNAIAQANYQQIGAEQALASAQATAEQAQKNLTLAREQAKQQIQDLTLSVQDGALAQRQANLNVITAKQQLDRVLNNKGSSQLQRAQAQLTYDQAVQQVTDLGVRQQRLADQQKAASKAGVEGSSQVISAQQNIAQANQGVDNALRNQANTARQGAASIAAAQLSFQNAQRQSAVAAQQTSSAASAAATALAGLSPAGQKFATFISDKIAPAFKQIKDAAAGGLLPGLQSALSGLLPFLPQIATLVGNVAGAVGDLFKSASDAVRSPFFKSFFKDLNDSIGPNVKTLGTILGNIATGFAGLFQAFAPVAAGMGGALKDLTGKFADFATHLSTNGGFQAFMGYIKTEGPVVASVIGSIFKVFGNLFAALAPLGAVMLGLVDAVAKVAASLGPQGLLLAVGGIAAAAALIGGSVGAILVALVAFAGAAVYTYNHSKALRDFLADRVIPVFKAVADYVTGKVVPVLEGLGKQALAGLRDAFGYVRKAIADNRPELEKLVGVLAAVGNFIVTKVVPILGPIMRAVLSNFGQSIGHVIDAVGFLIDAISAIVGAVKAVYNGASSIVSAIDGLPVRIRKAASGMFDGIKDAFKAAINYIIDAWNGLSFKLPTVDTHIPGIGKVGGFELSTPDITPLATGGIVTQPTLALVGEAGPEAVIPLSHFGSLAQALAGGGGAQSQAGAVGAAGNNISVVINNPTPEPATVSASAAMRRLQFTLGAS